MCRKYGATGPVIRGSGVPYDVRRVEPYSVYPEFDFVVPTFEEGDSMARYLVRMEEMAQSLRIIEQALDKLPAGPVMAEKVPRVLKLPAGDYCYAVEAARGRFAVRIVSDGKEIPYRVKLRTPVALQPQPVRGSQPGHAAARRAGPDGQPGPGHPGH